MIRLIKSASSWWTLALIIISLLAGTITDNLESWDHALPWLIVTSVVLIGIAFWRLKVQESNDDLQAKIDQFKKDQEFEENLRRQFALCKPASELQPSDFGFQVLDIEEAADPLLRPFHTPYIARTFTTIAGETRSLDESDLLGLVSNGGSIALIGPPTEGKSRTAYSLLKRVGDRAMVVTPLLDRPVPEDAAFMLLEGQQVVLVIDDLSNYVGGAVNLQEFVEKLKRAAESVAVLVTSRNGPELDAVRKAAGTNVHRVFEGLQYKLSFQPASDTEKSRLSDALDEPRLRADGSPYPTLGAITMANSMEAMAQRFHALSPEQQDVLHALDLLLSVGILPLSHGRLSAVLNEVFDRHSVHLGDLLSGLYDSGFIKRSGLSDPIFPERAYLSRDVIPYRSGRTMFDDLPRLRTALKSICDAKALFHLSIEWETAAGDLQVGLDCMQDAADCQPNDVITLVNLAKSLQRVGRIDDARETFDRAISIDPLDFTLPTIKANFLSDIGEHTEALDILDQVLLKREQNPKSGMPPKAEGKITDPEQDPFLLLQARSTLVPEEFAIWRVRADCLVALERDEEAVKSFREALQIVPDEESTVDNLSKALFRLGRFDEALTILNRAILIDPVNSEMRYLKARVLDEQKRFVESLRIYGALIDENPRNADAIHARASTLLGLERYGESLADFENLIALENNRKNAHYGQGMALAALGQHQKAIAAFEAELELDASRSEVWTEKGNSLLDLNLFDQSLLAYEEALSVDGSNIEALHNRAVAYERLDQFDKAVESFKQYLVYDPHNQDVRDILISHLLSLESFSEANTVVSDALALDPTNKHLLQVHFEIQLHLDNLAGAVRTADELLKLDPGDPVASFNKGSCLLTLRERGIEAEAPEEWLCSAWKGRSSVPDVAFTELIAQLIQQMGYPSDFCENLPEIAV